MKIFVKIVSIKHFKFFGETRYKVKFYYVYKSSFRKKILFIPRGVLNPKELSPVRSAMINSAVITTIGKFIESLSWDYLKDLHEQALHLAFCNLANLETISTLKFIVKV